MIFRGKHSPLSDADLMARVAHGDEKSFSELLHRHQAAVYAFACRLLGDEREAEDVAQETFLRLYRASGRYREEPSLRTYLFKIIKNLCIDHLRKKRPEAMDQLPDTPTRETPLDLLEGIMAVDRIQKAINDLPDNQKTALLLRHKEQMPYSRIAEVMDLSMGAVESLLVRGRRTLRQVLK